MLDIHYMFLTLNQTLHLPNKYICESSIIQADSLQMHTMKMFKVVVEPFLIFTWSNSYMATINAAYDTRETTTIK